MLNAPLAGVAETLEFTPRPASWVGARPYARAADPRPLDLRLDANEGLAPPESFLEACRLESRTASVYPAARELERLLAAEHDVSPDRVIVTAGADDAIERTCRVACEPGRTALLTDPTFEMLPRFLKACGGVGRTVPWLGTSFPVQAMIEAADSSTSLACVVSPNNPTGQVITPDELLTLRRGLPDALMLVDLAYIEYADADLTTFAASIPGTVVTRTFSKAWGIAGLRVGYAIADARVAPWLRGAGLPYAASAYSLSVASRWRAQGAACVRAEVNRVREARRELARTLTECGAEVIQSEGNFVLAAFDDAGRVADLLAGLGIGVRRFEQGTSLQRHLRISVPAADSVERLLRAIRATLRPEAILFDMDGVLADVAGSYRESIIRTCLRFGVVVTRADIAAVKAQGNANNDWEVSRRLIESRGVAAGFEQVRDVFESIYQGTETAPGLRATERLLVSRERLDSLRRRFRLGIVTGRPRADAIRFLREQGIESCFEAVVTMEEAALKPSPDPVLLCLSRLNVASAWMIGDTRDDVVASRAAGVVPIGVVPPGEDVESLCLSLTQAGAARVLRNAESLEELLP